jgi:hypothetical protein
VKKTTDEPHAVREVLIKVPQKAPTLKNDNPRGNPNNASRCEAKTRNGTPCRGPAMANGRCRMHGGTSTGPRTPEGLERSRKANWKHGYYSADAIAMRRYIRRLLSESRALMKKI